MSIRREKLKVEGQAAPKRRITAALAASLAVLVLVCCLALAQPKADGAQSTGAGEGKTVQAAQPEVKDDSFLGHLFRSDNGAATESREGWPMTTGRIALRLALAGLLAAMLAYRPRRKIRAIHHNPFVSETQILLAVVGSALMMIVADNAARAFGIFAAASLVRFRTNIRDPKEITVLLISLGIGLATGVGRFELAIVFSLFILLLLWVLEHYEPELVFRAMELKVKTRNVETTDELLKELFEKHQFSAEVRELNREDEKDPVGKIVYYVNVSPAVSTDQLSDEILSSDSENIDSIEWEQKKSTSYIYR